MLDTRSKACFLFVVVVRYFIMVGSGMLDGLVSGLITIGILSVVVIRCGGIFETLTYLTAKN